MRKLFILLFALAFGFSSTVANAQLIHSASQSKQTAGTIRSGKPHTRYKAKQLNKQRATEQKASSPAAVPSGQKKKDGSLDMRYKANQGSNKTTVKPKR